MALINSKNIRYNSNFNIISFFGTIPVSLQQNDWIGGFGRWSLLLTFRTAFMPT